MQHGRLEAPRKGGHDRSNNRVSSGDCYCLLKSTYFLTKLMIVSLADGLDASMAFEWEGTGHKNN